MSGMNVNFSLTRHTLFLAIFVCYFLPTVALNGYFALTRGLENHWEILSTGLFFSIFGSLLFFFLLTRWEIFSKCIPSPIINQASSSHSQVVSVENTIPDSTEGLTQINNELKTQVQSLEESISRITQEKESLQNEKEQLYSDNQKMSKQLEDAMMELKESHGSLSKQLELEQKRILYLQETMAEQKALAEKKQQLNAILETKVSDLTYEIKTLLQLAETHSSVMEPDEAQHSKIPFPFEKDSGLLSQAEKQIHTSEEASAQLKRCLDIAQKITGSHHFGNPSSAFMNFPADSFAIDLRRLCDSLRSENNSAILFYSPKENQMLFTNHLIKTLTGWSPEKFAQNFSQIMQNQDIWTQGIASLSMRSEAQIKLLLKTKSGQDTPFQAHLGIIPTGIFKHHIIAVLY